MASINLYLQERGMRAGTENAAFICAMAAALAGNCSEIDKNICHLKRLEKELLDTIDIVPYIRNGGSQILPGLLSLSFPGFDGESILHRLDLRGISISTGSACDSKNTQISHVLRAIGLENEAAAGTVRISFGKNNTIEDAVIIGKELLKIIG